ncbi:hypothetical protein SAMD00019534_107870 [Acytostelium subglobosum LB1]|uniref:hypothetical protein n=1 Tax=Acytostelium subglobosum LB1 TaxID=1410327 RepID=UPI000644CE0C|nr:hypothetical protein SAMD00019534_107870 [Acytostelium subglobosum LB1]GAM27611.1 hypothetical protein SAMD00019534_107870 [Acytostelium subglobosum LB1]|eukprot:XP_012749270.1 hypothetical protein SAMD00019534_107870 [Acytostelium subglobosum LB1]
MVKMVDLLSDDPYSPSRRIPANTTYNENIISLTQSQVVPFPFIPDPSTSGKDTPTFIRKNGRRYSLTPIFQSAPTSDADQLTINCLEVIKDDPLTLEDNVSQQVPEDGDVSTSAPATTNNNNFLQVPNPSLDQSKDMPSIRSASNTLQVPKGVSMASSQYKDLRKSTNYVDLQNAFSLCDSHREEIDKLHSDENFEHKFTDSDPTQESQGPPASPQPGQATEKEKLKESNVLFGLNASPSVDSPTMDFSSPTWTHSPVPHISSPMMGAWATDDEQSPVIEGERRVVAEMLESNLNSPTMCRVEKIQKKERRHLFNLRKKNKLRKQQHEEEERLEREHEATHEDTLSEEGRHTMKVISALLNKLFDKKKYSTLTIFMGLSLLNSYYKELVLRSWEPMSNHLLLEEALRYQKFCTASYGRKLYFGLMSKSTLGKLRGVLGTDNANLKVIRKHTGIKKEDIIVSKWFSSKYSPGHFIAIDHQTKSVVLSIRGTFNHLDVITDLVAKSSFYKGPKKNWHPGYIHLGILLCAHKKLKETEELLVKAIHCHPGYRLIVTGHSLGAGVASLFTFLFYDKHPLIPLHCYSFGPPCILSYELATHEVVQSLVSSFAMNDDLVPRLSFNSLYYLREVLDNILSQSKTKMQRGFQIVSAGGGLGERLTKKISKVLKVSPTIDLSHVEHHDSGEVHMFPPGKMMRIVKIKKGVYVAEKVRNQSFDKIIVSSTMFTDHMPQKYEKGLESAISNIGNVELITPPPDRQPDDVVPGSNNFEGIPTFRVSVESMGSLSSFSSGGGSGSNSNSNSTTNSNSNSSDEGHSDVDVTTPMASLVPTSLRASSSVVNTQLPNE